MSPELDSKEPPISNVGARALRVMVADDGKNVADIMGMFFEMEGHEVRVVYGGEEAVRAADEEEPDVIFMDLSMPDMDGLEATRRIREAHDGGGPVIIALSGYDQEEIKRLCEQAGMQRLVAKPVSPEDLRALLAEFGGPVVR